jgi:hypothetical protein
MNHFRSKLHFALFVLSVLMLATPIQAATISTIFSSNNLGSEGGAIYFDIQTANTITITGFTTNLYSGNSGAAFTVSIYRTAAGTSYSGSVADSSLWSLVATGTGTAVAEHSPSTIVLSNAFTLSASSLYGLAIGLDRGTGHYYTNGTGSNQTYSNSDLTLTLGSATNSPFDSDVFSPRVWNGSITYTAADTATPEPATFATLAAGIGLLGLLHRRRA